MNEKLKETTIKKAMIALATGNVTIADFYFYEEDIGYLQINEFTLGEDGSIKIGNYQVDIKNEYELDDKIFERTIDN